MPNINITERDNPDYNKITCKAFIAGQNSSDHVYISDENESNSNISIRDALNKLCNIIENNTLGIMLINYINITVKIDNSKKIVTYNIEL